MEQYLLANCEAFVRLAHVLVIFQPANEDEPTRLTFLVSMFEPVKVKRVYKK